jgi:Flp pilus assembly protein TadG
MPGRTAHARLARRMRGAAIVEFALVATLFLTLLLSIMDFGRILLAWNTAAEATRWGARIAVVCGQTPADIRSKMKMIMPQLQDANIEITWFDPEGVVSATCTATNCKGVRVSLHSNPDNPADPANVRIPTFSPFTDLLLPPVPAFPAYLPRESMEAVSSAGDPNPICL